MITLREIGKKIIPHKWQPASFYKKMRGNGKVMTGPFKGMGYLNTSVGSCFSPKIYGTYEKELHEIVNNVAKKGFDKIIVIGGGEGYYAAGLGKLFPDLEILVFEINPEGQKAILQLADINSLSNLKVFGKCTAESLRDVINNSSKNFIIVDIEGEEINLLGEDIVSSLNRSDILVEIHDFIDRSIGEKLKVRFSKTHKLNEVFQKDRKIADLPVQLTAFEKLMYKKIILNWLSEYRGDKMRWFYLEPLINEDPTY